MHLVERRVRVRGQRDERGHLDALVRGRRPRFCSVQVEVVAHGELLTVPRRAREREGSEMVHWVQRRWQGGRGGVGGAEMVQWDT